MMNRKQFIVITSIFPPTEGVKRFSNLKGYKTIIIGDKKTPENWKCENADFISVDDQNELGWNIAKKLPYNHYCRKMIGYIYAVRKGAEVIVDADDDNKPKSNWMVLPSFGDYLTSKRELGFVNVYKRYTPQEIWPRGFPLTKVNDKQSVLNENDLRKSLVEVGVWQGLVDNDADVDAIYRLTNNRPCFFEKKEPVVLNKGTICPFNSQNTVFCLKELFPLLYLPAYVNFRFTDILRGLVAQPIMWAKEYLLGFCTSTVVQERNPHDYLEDFVDEIPCYLYPEHIIDLVSGITRSSATVSDNIYEAYSILEKKSITTGQEIELLSEWLKEVM